MARVAEAGVGSSGRAQVPGAPEARSAGAVLREVGMGWAAGALLPLPALVMMDPGANAAIACLYLGVACAWLATEIFWHGGGLPASRAEWRVKTIAVGVAVVANLALFVAMGLAAGVSSRLPFPLMAALSATPALGLVPWLTIRVRQRYAAIMVGAMILVGAKLSACVVTRVVYGPDFIALGYVAADWRTAKLMITLFWVLTVLSSVGGLVGGYLRMGRTAS